MLRLFRAKRVSVGTFTYMIVIDTHSTQKVWQLDYVFGQGRSLLHSTDFDESPS